MKEYNRARKYDGINSDLSFQLTYVSNKKGKIKKIVHSKNIVINDYLLMENCKLFYEERIKNYRQMLSDFTYFPINNNIDVFYYPPLIMQKNDDIIFCHIKIDDINNLRFMKFNFTTLSDELCFHNYVGDIDNYMKNVITSDKGFNFYIKNKKKNFNNLKEVIEFYLEKAKMKNCFHSMDNIIALTDNYQNVATKYLKRQYLKTNLLIKNLNNCNNNLTNLCGVYLSKYGNLLYVVQGCDNPCEQYDKIIPTLENSYDILKQYIIMNEYLCKKYKNYYAYSIKTKKLKKDLEEICSFESIKNDLLKKSMYSVHFIVKEFERTCYDINFNKQLNRIKKNIIKELKKRDVPLSEFISITAARTIGEIYDKTLDKIN